MSLMIKLGGYALSQERIVRVSVLRRQEMDTPVHFIKNCKSTHDGRVSKDRKEMADGNAYISVLAATWQF